MNYQQLSEKDEVWRTFAEQIAFNFEGSKDPKQRQAS